MVPPGTSFMAPQEAASDVPDRLSDKSRTYVVDATPDRHAPIGTNAQLTAAGTAHRPVNTRHLSVR
jgi:hypothetical protein